MRRRVRQERPDPVLLRDELIRPLLGMEVRCWWCRDEPEKCVSCWWNEWQFDVIWRCGHAAADTPSDQAAEEAPAGLLFRL